MKHKCTYIRDIKIVMRGPYCIHVWYLNLPCGFAEPFPAITWRVLVKSKQIACITHLIIVWINQSINQNKYISLPNNKNTSIAITVLQ